MVGDRSHRTIGPGVVVAVLLSLEGATVTDAANGASRSANVAAGVRANGPPSLIAVLRRGSAPLNTGFDADGDFVAWTGERLPDGSLDCAVHFIRISDGRRSVAGRACDVGIPGSLALNRSRVLWAVVWGSNVESGADIFAARFGSRLSRSLGGGSRVCGEVGTANPEECDFEEPIIDSSGGSVVAQFQTGDAVSGGPTVIKRLVGDSVTDVPVPAGRGLAVHGSTIALVTRQGDLELRRLADGVLLRRWDPARPVVRIAMSKSLLVSESASQDGRRRRIDLYDTTAGRLEVSVGYGIPKGFPTELRSRPLANGVVFFAGRKLRYTSRTGRTSVLASTRGTPSQLAVAGDRVIWIERSGDGERLYSVRVRLSRL